MDSAPRRLLAAGIGALALVVGIAAACKPHPDRPPRTTATTGTTVPGAIDCGTLNYTSGAPTTRLVIIESEGRCLLDAFAAGRPAHFVTITGTDGSRVVYDVLGPRLLRVTTATLVQECTNLSTDTSYLKPGNCSPVPPGAPPLEGIDCGVIAYASGWPTTFPQNLTMGAGKCFTDAWAAGTPARMVTRDQTDGEGGHIRITTYDVLGSGQLRVITDNRQSAPPGGITTKVCTSLTATMSQLQPGGCTPA